MYTEQRRPEHGLIESSRWPSDRRKRGELRAALIALAAREEEKQAMSNKVFHHQLSQVHPLDQIPDEMRQHRDAHRHDETRRKKRRVRMRHRNILHALQG